MFVLETADTTYAVNLRVFGHECPQHRPAEGKQFNVELVRIVYHQSAACSGVVVKVRGDGTHEWLYSHSDVFPGWLVEQVDAHRPDWFNDAKEN